MTTSLRDAQPARRPQVWLREARGEIALLDRDTGSLHLLNDTARAIWDLCDGHTRPSEMIAAICEISGLHADVVGEDVDRILSQFEGAGLIEWGS